MTNPAPAYSFPSDADMALLGMQMDWSDCILDDSDSIQFFDRILIIESDPIDKKIESSQVRSIIKIFNSTDQRIIGSGP